MLVGVKENGSFYLRVGFMKKFIAMLMTVALVSPFAVGCGDSKTDKTKVKVEEKKPSGETETRVKEVETTTDTDRDGGSKVTKETTESTEIDK